MPNISYGGAREEGGIVASEDLGWRVGVVMFWRSNTNLRVGKVEALKRLRAGKKERK